MGLSGYLLFASRLFNRTFFIFLNLFEYLSSILVIETGKVSFGCLSDR